jgi:putative MFS transporter
LAWYLSGRYFIESPRWLAGKGQRSAAENTSSRWSRKSRKRKHHLTGLAKRNIGRRCVESGSFWLLFKGQMLRRTLVAITVLIAMNISLYTITVWIPTIFVNSGIDVTNLS